MKPGDGIREGWIVMRAGCIEVGDNFTPSVFYEESAANHFKDRMELLSNPLRWKFVVVPCKIEDWTRK